MTAKARPWALILLPYLAVWLGIWIFHSAWAALLGFHLALLPVLFLGSVRIRSSRFLPSAPWGWILPVVLSGLLGGLLLWQIWPRVGIPIGYPGMITGLGLNQLTWPCFIVYFALINPLLEEWYWRVIFGSDSPWLVPVDFLFAGYHLFILAMFVNLQWQLAAFLALAAAGWFWRQALRAQVGLLSVALAHGLADLTILLVLYSFSA
jgi:hypothetical protein